MTTELILLLIIIVTALAFDFTNGFHDTANAMATSIATGALKPKTAVILAGCLNFVGAFISIEVAKTVAKGIVRLEEFDLSDNAQADTLLLIVFCGLIGGILWNLFTWLFGIPSSSSHSLFGGLIGAAIGAMGFGGVLWDGVLNKIIVPAVAAPVVAGLVAACGTAGVYYFTSQLREKERDNYFRWGQIGSASLVALAHGTSDAQKTMGVIFLALVATGHLDESADMPVWVTFACATAIALGTYSGGWRVIRTLGKGLVEISSPQGMAAETASAVIILSSSHLGMALSTTHVATGSILGTGVGKKGAEVRWNVAGRMAIAWITTLPIAAIVAGVLFWISDLISNATNAVGGALFALAVLVVLVLYMLHRARQNPIHSGNVNDDWDGDGTSDTDADSRAAAQRTREKVGVGASAEPVERRDSGEPADFVDTSRGSSSAFKDLPGESGETSANK